MQESYVYTNVLNMQNVEISYNLLWT